MTTPLIRLLLSYIIGGYIKIYNLNYKFIWKKIGIFYFIFSIFYLLLIQYKNYNCILFKIYLSFNINSFMSIIGSMGIIFLFKNFSFYSKKINWISSSVLGIYLIHGNKNISPYIYNIWFATNNVKDSYFFVKYIIKGILILLISLIIDIIRRYTIGLLFNKILSKIIFNNSIRK